MRFPTRYVLFLACWAHALATPAVIEDGSLGRESSIRDPKLLFQFITIAPEACRSTSGAQAGICYSAADCTTLGGTNDGTCAKGLGVCCLINRTCRGVSAFRETTFVNPNHPAAQTAAISSCQLRITPVNNNICQLRLDFEDFTLNSPDVEGVCDQDFFQVNAGSSNVPLICGDNTGQHMYVDVSPQFGSALLNIDTSSANSRWRIKVTQIECNSPDRAPAGCLQFFNTTTGTISSFNYNAAGTDTGATRQLDDQAYGVCIKSQPGYCSITYSQTPGSAFSLSADASGNPTLPPLVGDDPDVSQGCPVDYIIIPGGVITDTTNVPAGVTSADRYCGLSFPGATTIVQPFNLFVVSENREAPAGDNYNQGFRLNYRMNAC